MLANSLHLIIIVEGVEETDQLEFFRGLPALTRKYGTLLLLDEVVTGFREAVGGWQSVIGIIAAIAVPSLLTSRMAR